MKAALIIVTLIIQVALGYVLNKLTGNNAACLLLFPFMMVYRKILTLD